MKIITVATSKGGGGKTTLAVGIAAQFARNGKKSLLIDFDPQASATISLGVNPTALRSVASWMLDEDAIVDMAVKTHENLFLLPGHETVITARAEFEQAVNEATALERISMMMRLGTLIREEAGAYDVVVLDTPADNILREACVLAADVVVSPVPPTQADMEGFALFVGQISTLFSMAGFSVPAMVVANKIDDRHRAGRQRLHAMMDEIGDAGDGFDFAGVVHQSVAITDSFGGTPIPLANRQRRNRRAQDEIDAITKRVMEKIDG